MSVPNGRRRPSLDLLRDLTDAHLLDQLLDHPELTRAEIAARTGISKPTISESARRLVAAGTITESGRQSGKRGPSATYYRLAGDVGCAFVQSAGPTGVHTELRDVRGGSLREHACPLPEQVTSTVLGPIMAAEAATVLREAPGPVLAATVSVANPVDARTGRLVRLPDSPFLLDELRPGDVLDDLLGVPARVDNDVNWAALAELRSGAARGLDDVVYGYLGPGLGLGLVLDGRLVRGDRGLAGELAYVLTTGPRRQARRLLEALAEWDFLRAGSWALDVDRLAQVLGGGTAADRRRRDDVVEAVAGAFASLVAVINPHAVVLADRWTGGDQLVAMIAERVAALAPVAVEVRAAALDDSAPLLGARAEAVELARARLTTA